jgi:hypothetical protein
MGKVLITAAFGRFARTKDLSMQVGLGEVWNASELSGLVVDVSKTGGKRRTGKKQFKDLINLQPYSKDDFSMKVASASSSSHASQLVITVSLPTTVLGYQQP